MNLINSGITSSLENSPYELEFYREYLDTLLFPDPADQQQIRASLLAKYRNRKPDVIITVGPSPLRLLAETHETFFPGVPVVFALPNAGSPGSPTLDSHFAGVQDAIQAGGTVDLALRLQPGTQHVVVVGGTAAFDQQIEAVVRQQLRPYEGQLDVSYLTDIDMPGLLQRLKHLPDHTIILLTSFSQDAAGTRFISGSQAASLVVGAANAPVFSLYDVFLNHGEVGGRVSSLLRDGEMAGRMALRALNGEKTQDISVATSPPVDLFDWRALQRWGLKESNLPPGSTVLNRQPSLWESFRRYVIGGMTLILAEALLISGLLWQRTRRKAAETKLAIANKQLEADIADRKRAEATLRESEERLRLAVQAGKMFGSDWDAATDKIVRSGGVKQILGEDEGIHSTGQQIMSKIPPEDRERLNSAVAELSPEKPILQIKYRIVRSDGAIVWVDRNSRAYFDEHGKILRIVGMLADITDRVRAEEALQKSQRQLLLVYSNVADCIFDVAVESNDRYRFLSVNPAFLKATGLSEDQVVGKLVQEVIPKPALTMVLRKYEEAIGGKKTVRWEETSEYPAGRKVGEVVVAPVFDGAGRCTHLVGAVHDITERRLAEENLADLSRKLLEAQEQERSRIGRELHDDINQRLALLSVEIQRVTEVSPVTYAELRSRMDELGKRTSEISAGVQSLSHELHSSKLEYLGLVSAMRGFCKEFGEKHKVEVAFASEGMPAIVPPEVSLCLFRVMQEGLHNALKHSGVRLFEVKMQGSHTEIHLTVRDSGVGFDSELIKDTPGLGLVSMQERVRLVKGTISITSKLQSGTEINVRVPLQAGAQMEQAKLAGA
jgi:PAS domain S-box-containing protein